MSGGADDIDIRPVRREDAAAVHDLTARAFAASELGHHGEADLVSRLREACPDAIELVAEKGGAVVGHILFTPARLEGDARVVHGLGLAPMSVDPALQSSGIGSRLVHAGLDAARATEAAFVIVLGHEKYYPRFGFTVASGHGVRCEFDGIPDELFLIQGLRDGALEGAEGTVARYHAEFHRQPDAAEDEG